MSDGRPFFFQTPSWSRGAGSTILRRAYHSSPDPFYSSLVSGKRVVWTLIGLNTAVFGAWQYAQSTNDHKLNSMLQKHAILSERNLNAGRYHTYITSAFSHQSLWHFLANMFCLNAFGSVISANGVGGARLLILALGSGLAGSLALHYQKAPKTAFKKKPADNIWRRVGLTSDSMNRHWGALGASGVAMGLGGAATLLRPFATMTVYGIIPVPLVVLIGGLFAYDNYYLDSKTSTTGHAAHLGGLAFGAVYYLVSLRRFGGVWQMARRTLRR